MMTEHQERQAKVRPDLFLPRHPGDVVRLATALAVLLVSIKLVNRNHIDELEIDAFRLVNDLPSVLYRPLWLVMQLGNVLVVPVVVGVAAFTRRLRLAVNLAVAGFGCYLLAIVVKNLVHRGRPSQYLPGVNLHGPAASGLGYISGHAAVAVALASVASPYLTRRARRVAWTLAVAVCLSRVYVGAHWPLDVIGGAAVGFAVGAAVHLILGLPAAAHQPAASAASSSTAGSSPMTCWHKVGLMPHARPGSRSRPRMGSGCSSSSSRVSVGTGILRIGCGGS
jgi:glycosyltransferase 2 family protein